MKQKQTNRWSTEDFCFETEPVEKRPSSLWHEVLVIFVALIFSVILFTGIALLF